MVVVGGTGTGKGIEEKAGPRVRCYGPQDEMDEMDEWLKADGG